MKRGSSQDKGRRSNLCPEHGLLVETISLRALFFNRRKGSWIDFSIQKAVTNPRPRVRHW